LTVYSGISIDSLRGMKFVVKESTVGSRRIELSPYQLGHIVRRNGVRLRRSNDMERPWQPNDLKKNNLSLSTFKRHLNTFFFSISTPSAFEMLHKNVLYKFTAIMWVTR